MFSPGVSVRRRWRQCREDRLGEPFVDEWLETKRFETIREREVALEPSISLVVVEKPGRRTDQYDALHEPGRIERKSQRDATTHRVAEVVRSTTDETE